MVAPVGLLRNLLNAGRIELEHASCDARLRLAELREHRGDVDVAMGGRVRTEPSHRLLQLALAAVPVRTPGLVPGHRDVNQSLEEVALAFLRRPPRELELLVCGEELAATDKVNPLLKVRL